MSFYIMSFVMSQPNIAMSWGISEITPLHGDEGIKFHVEGYKFSGWVKIVYDLGSDLFNIFYIDNDGNTQMIQKGIYADCLVKTIDDAVEKTNDYEQRVKEDYKGIVL